MPEELKEALQIAEAVLAARDREESRRWRYSWIGEDAPFRVLERPEWRYGRWRIASNKSHQRYEVLWPSRDLWCCSCPDARTSELSVCKHSAFVQMIAPVGGGPMQHAAVMIRPASSFGGVAERLQDFQIYLPGVGALADSLDESGRPLDKVGPSELRAALAAVPNLLWAEGAKSVLQDLVAEEDWRARFAVFEAGVRAHLERGEPAPVAWARMRNRLSCALRPYQVDGVLFAVRERRALLADDMGLGKTFQAIATMVLLRELGEGGRTLIVCPASLKSQWVSEIAKFAGSSIRAEIVEGRRVRRRTILRKRGVDTFVMNYATLRNDIGEVSAGGVQHLIVDEAQRIKNWNTKTAKAVKALRTPRVLALTGTPLENRLTELHSVMELVEPRALGPMWRLMPEHAVRGRDDKLESIRGLSLLRRRMTPHVLRRTKAEVLRELPERSDETVAIEWSSAQEAAQAPHLRRVAMILAKDQLTQDDLLRLMTELQCMRMISNGLALYLFDEIAPRLKERKSLGTVERRRSAVHPLRSGEGVGHETDRTGTFATELATRYPSPKLDAAKELLLDLVDAGQKVVVFSQWDRMLTLVERLVAPGLARVDAQSVRFHGQLSAAQRSRRTRQFRDDASARLFLSTDAGGVGLNLQDAASTVVHLEVPWNPAILEQRVGRVHRMGQKGKVRAITLMSDGGIEPRMAVGLLQKRALFEAIFEGAERLSFEERPGLVRRLREVFAPSGASTSLVKLTPPVDATTCLPPEQVPM